MAMTANPVSRDVLAQIVKDPRYPEAMRIPFLAFQQLSLVLLSIGLFLGSSYAYLQGMIPVWAAIPINIVAVYIAFTPMHDASHRAVSSNDKLNDFLGVLTGQLLLPGVNMTVFRTIHMDHHRYVGEEGRDPDTGFVDVPKWMGLTYLMFADVHWVIWYYKHGRHFWSRKVAIYFHIMLFVAVGAHVALLASPWWKEFLILYVIPQRLGLGIVAYTFAHIQHPSGLTWAEQPFQSTLYVRGKSALRRLMFGQEEHVIHHLTPHIPWYKYKRIWPLANEVLTRQGIPSRGWFEGPGEIVLPTAEDLAPIPMAVAELHDEANGIRSLLFTPADGRRLSIGEAGAHVELHLPGGLVRQYSLVEHDRKANGWRIAVKREDNGRGGSRAVHALAKGDVIEVSRPRNNFVLYESAPAFRLVSGGIGITAILPMAVRLARLAKPFTLHVCARDRASLAFGEALASEPLAGHVELHFDGEGGCSSLDPASALRDRVPGELLYLCGPAGFMEWLKREAVARGWPSDAIRIENFGANLAADSENRPFRLKLARSHREVEVPKERTILDTLAHAGIDVPYACMQGTCGRCVAPVADGEIEHRDAYLTEEERAQNDRLCLCVSRAKGEELTLDI